MPKQQINVLCEVYYGVRLDFAEAPEDLTGRMAEWYKADQTSQLLSAFPFLVGVHGEGTLARIMGAPDRTTIFGDDFSRSRDPSCMGCGPIGCVVGRKIITIHRDIFDGDLVQTAEEGEWPVVSDACSSPINEVEGHRWEKKLVAALGSEWKCGIHVLNRVQIFDTYVRSGSEDSKFQNNNAWDWKP